ncbi:MAG: hypothetical protein ACTSWY_03975 [Promethearchaeota archaeon]
MTEIFLKGLERLEELYYHLIEEPTPDEEIDARQEMIIIFQELISDLGKDQETTLELKPILQNTLDLIKNWDTLDNWFTEVPELVSCIQEILGISESEKKGVQKVSQIESKEEVTPKEEKQIKVETKSSALKEDIKNKPPKTPSINQKIVSNNKLITPIESPFISAVETISKESITKLSEATAKPNINIALKDSIETIKSKEVSPEQTANITSKQKVIEDLLQQGMKIKKKSSSIRLKPKLKAPKVIIPKVVKPIKKIIPKLDKPKISREKPKSSDVKPKSPIIKSISLKKPPVPKKVAVPKLSKMPKKPNQLLLKTSQMPKFQPKQKNIPQLSQLEAPKRELKSDNKSKVKLKVSIKPEKNVKKKKNILISTPFVTPPDNNKPRLNIQAQHIEPNVDMGVKIVKPVNIKVKNSRNNLFEAFTKQKDPLKPKTERTAPKNEFFNSKIVEPDVYGSFDTASPRGLVFSKEVKKYQKMNKETLYRELIGLEGRKYAIEKAKKEMRIKFEKELIEKVEYYSALDRVKYDLEHISKKINEIREQIQAL